MTPDQTSTQLPTWAVNALAWLALLILGSFGTVIWWLHRRYFSKVDGHGEQIAKLSSTYATIESMSAMDKRLDY